MIDQPNLQEEPLENEAVTLSPETSAHVEMPSEEREEVSSKTTEGDGQPTPDDIIAALSQEIVALQQALEEQQQQGEALKNRYISLAAEFDNFRKRTQKEKQDLEVQVKGQTLRELLAVVDNFERARTQIKPSNDGEALIHNSYQGVYKSLVDSLKRLGVSAMNPKGEPFDPIYHEAMLQEATNEYPEGTVLEQLVRGYLLDGQVLRHALVKVAAPKETEDSTEANPVMEESA